MGSEMCIRDRSGTRAAAEAAARAAAARAALTLRLLALSLSGAALASALWPGLQLRRSGASTSAPVGRAVSGEAGSEAEGEAGCEHGSGEDAIAATLAAAAAAAAWSSQPCHCADRQSHLNSHLLGRSTHFCVSFL